MSELSHGAYSCGKCEQGFDRFNDYMAHGCIQQLASARESNSPTNNAREHNAFVALVIAVLVNMLFFAVLAIGQDRLNARIRELEIKAGMGDKWAE